MLTNIIDFTLSHPHTHCIHMCNTYMYTYMSMCTCTCIRIHTYSAHIAAGEGAICSSFSLAPPTHNHVLNQCHQDGPSTFHLNPKGEKGNLLRQFHSEPNLQVSSCLLWAIAVGGASDMECPSTFRGEPRLRSAALVCLLLPPPPAWSSILGAGERDEEVEKG